MPTVGSRPIVSDASCPSNRFRATESHTSTAATVVIEYPDQGERQIAGCNRQDVNLWSLRFAGGR